MQAIADKEFGGVNYEHARVTKGKNGWILQGKYESPEIIPFDDPNADQRILNHFTGKNTIKYKKPSPIIDENKDGISDLIQGASVQNPNWLKGLWVKPQSNLVEKKKGKYDK